MVKHGNLWDKNIEMEKELHKIKESKDKDTILDSGNSSDDLDLTMTRSQK